MSSLPALAPVTPSEDVLSAKTDLCISNAIVKAGTGLGVGILASAVLFRRRPWPVLLGLGFGLGSGYSDCQRVFNPAAVPGFVIVPSSSSPLPPSEPFPFLASLKSEVTKDVKALKELVVDASSQTEKKVDKVVEKVTSKRQV